MRVFSAALDVLYPRKCALCGNLADSPVCAGCLSHFEPFDDHAIRQRFVLDYVAALFVYTGFAATAVQRLKYERATSVAEWMAGLMLHGAKIRGLLDVDAFVPVPIHWTRTVARGFNQADLLCEQLPVGMVRRDLLRRTRATRPQVGLSHEERANNIEGAFEAIGEVRGLDVLLVDDVLTSGGTARECATTLKEAGASQVGIYSFAAERLWKAHG